MVSTRSLDDMEAWRQSLLRAKTQQTDKSAAFDAMLESSSGSHQWCQANHPRPTFCNYCREKLSGVPWHGYACEVCKLKAHKKCMEKIVDRCKWTFEASIPQHLQYISPENSIVPHQWVEGNLPMSAKCVVCEKPCGSVIKLQDWRCLWCACCVHSACLSQLGRGCSLGPASLSVVPPLAIRDVNALGIAALRDDAFGGECGGGSPLVVLVNSKSGDNQGQRMIRKFKRLLNPIQVFDIIASGPEFALTFFDLFEAFRVLVCGGDGTVGWVLSAFDKLNLHSKCQLAILPLGTGNDLARVLGWGHAFYDDTQLPQLVRTFERAHTRMLDRWSVLSIEGPQADAVRQYEEVVIGKVRAVLDAEQPKEVIDAVTALCATIRELMQDVAAVFTRVEEWERQDGRIPHDPISEQCTVLLEKLDKLMRTLKKETIQVEESGFEPEDEDYSMSEDIRRRDSLVNRANSLKKALRDMISLAERGIDQHYRDSAIAKRERFRKKRSKTTPSVLRVSNSNLSSSSACSPPASPSPKHKPSGDDDGGCASTSHDRPRLLGVADDSGVALSASDATMFNRTPTSGYVSGMSQSHSHSSNTGLSPGESTFLAAATSSQPSTSAMAPAEKIKIHLPTEDSNVGPSIGPVQPPTPGGTREHSANIEDTAFPMTPDRPAVSSTSRSSASPDACDDLQDLEPMGLFKPSSDCQLYAVTNGRGTRDHPASPSDIKLSHSDSSIYDHMESSVAQARSSVAEGSWGRILRERKRQSNATQSQIPADFSSSTSQLRSCRNLLCTTGFAGGSLIAEVLLLNARILGATQTAAGIASGECQTPLDQYKELKVMNNYFGIGLDAKIALEFHNKREESEKTRSRSKLFMWYGMLGGKELMHRTYRNLDQRIRLECDGVPIDLPSLQGIVILNIPSYSGGANFWGSAKDDNFTAQSFDDRVLEVVALFGVIHVATSRVPNVVRLQNHRIAQCRHVRIVILGDEPIPVQVDGEPWLQPPGIMQIVHKNRAQLLVRNPVFDATLKKWEEQKERSTTAPSTPTALSSNEDVSFQRRAAEFVRLVESEMAQLGVSSAFLEALDAAAVAVRGCGSAEDDERAEQKLDLNDREEALAAVERVVELLEDHFGWPERTKLPAGQPRLGPAPQFTFEVHGDEPDNWRFVINSIRQEMVREESALRELRHPELQGGRSKRSRLAEWLSRKFGRRNGAPSSQVATWSVDDVATWLGSVGLSQYATQFKANDIQGSELIHLERGDLKDLGVNKIGHVKRLQTAIDDLREKEAEKRKTSRHSGVGGAAAGRTSGRNQKATMSTLELDVASSSTAGASSSKLRKGASLSVERRSSATTAATPEQPSLNSL